MKYFRVIRLYVVIVLCFVFVVSSGQRSGNVHSLHYHSTKKVSRKFYIDLTRPQQQSLSMISDVDNYMSQM